MCVYTHWILACSGSTASSVPHSQPPVILYAAGHNVMFLLFTRFVHIVKIEGILTNFTCSGSVSLFEPMPVISVILPSYTCSNSTWTEIPIEADPSFSCFFRHLIQKCVHIVHKYIQLLPGLVTLVTPF